MAEEQITKGNLTEPVAEIAKAGGDNPAGTEMTVSTRRALIRAYRVEVVLAVSLGAYVLMAVLAHYYAYFSWDLNLARAIQSISLPGFRTLMVWVSALGSGWMPPVLVGAAGLALLAMRFRTEGAICLLGPMFGGIANRVLKAISARPRPDESLVQVMREYGHESFPSGHVVFFVVFFGFLFFLSYVLLRRGRIRRAALAALGALILLVGVSRVYMGAHWPSDVIGAYLAGGSWLLLMIEVYRRRKANRQRAAGA